MIFFFFLIYSRFLFCRTRIRNPRQIHASDRRPRSRGLFADERDLRKGSFAERSLF